MTVPFISTDDLGIEDLDEARAVIALDSACETVRTYLNRKLNLVTETRRFDGTGTDTLVLHGGPIVEVLTVTIYPDADEPTELAETDWLVDEGAALLYYVGSRWPKGRRVIEVEYTHGYAVEEIDVDDSGEVTVERVPADIREVALELAKSIYSASAGTVATGIVEETVGPDTYSYKLGSAGEVLSAGGLSPDQLARLHPYRWMPV